MHVTLLHTTISNDSILNGDTIRFAVAMSWGWLGHREALTLGQQVFNTQLPREAILRSRATQLETCVEYADVCSLTLLAYLAFGREKTYTQACSDTIQPRGSSLVFARDRLEIRMT